MKPCWMNDIGKPDVYSILSKIESHKEAARYALEPAQRVASKNSVRYWTKKLIELDR